MDARCLNNQGISIRRVGVGDFRLSVKISLVGEDFKTRKIDWYVNWQPDYANKVYKALINLGKESGLEFDVLEQSELWELE